jgi:S-adenosylmethionine-diacylglycerol 3-amino-3-carboxypropyl transferase
VHRHLSKQGLLERAFTFAFRGLVYAQIWEDPEVDLHTAHIALNRLNLAAARA